MKKKFFKHCKDIIKETILELKKDGFPENNAYTIDYVECDYK